MKKILFLVLALAMLLSCVACENESADNDSKVKDTTSAKADDSSNAVLSDSVSSEGEGSLEVSSEASEEEIVYEVNLPDDVVLKIADKEVSIAGKLAHEIFDALAVEYEELILHPEYEVPPSTLYYKPNHPNAVMSCVALDERLESDYKTLFLHSISVNFLFPDRPEVEFLGIKGETTEADLFKTFGEPDNYTEDKRHSSVTYYWRGFQIGDTTYKSLSVQFIDDSIYEVILYLS